MAIYIINSFIKSWLTVFSTSCVASIIVIKNAIIFSFFRRHPRLTQDEVTIHFITTRILSFFSFIPNLCLVILIIFRKKYHNSGNILVFQLSLACILFISSYCFPLLENSSANTTTGICYFQALINITFDISIMFFTLGISYKNYISFVEPDKVIEKKKKC